MACEGVSHCSKCAVGGKPRGLLFLFFLLIFLCFFFFYVNVKEHHVGSAKAHTLEGYNNDKNPQSLLPIEH
jgi:hypothetical protein